MTCYTGPALEFGQVGIGKNCSEMGVDKPLFSLMVSLPGLWISIVLLRLVSFGFGWIDVVAPARSCRWCGRALPRLAREEKSEFTEEHRDALLKPERIGMKCFRLLVRDAAVALTHTPIAFSRQHVAALREAGCGELEILDLINSAAFFNWANRLMLSLGAADVPKRYR